MPKLPHIGPQIWDPRLRIFWQISQHRGYFTSLNRQKWNLYVSNYPKTPNVCKVYFSDSVPGVKPKAKFPSPQDHPLNLDKFKASVMENGGEIVQWLRTNKLVHVKGVDPGVIELFRNAEHFCSLHGLLLADVPLEHLQQHVATVEHLKDLFSPDFIKRERLWLYGDCRLPLLRKGLVDSCSGHSAPISEQPQGSLPSVTGSGPAIYTSMGSGRSLEDPKTSNSVLATKRQMLIERLSFAEALESARQEASNLMELQKPTDLPALTSVCQEWISDVAEFIKRDRRRCAGADNGGGDLNGSPEGLGVRGLSYTSPGVSKESGRPQTDSCALGFRGAALENCKEPSDCSATKSGNLTPPTSGPNIFGASRNPLHSSKTTNGPARNLKASASANATTPPPFHSTSIPLPPQLDETTLASTTVKVALQLMCFPAYSMDTKGQGGGSCMRRRRWQQTAGNQILLSHAAVKLGDEIGRLYARRCLSNSNSSTASSHLGDKSAGAMRSVAKDSLFGFINSLDQNTQIYKSSDFGSASISKNKVSSTSSIPFIASTAAGASQARVISNVAGVCKAEVEEHTDHTEVSTLVDDVRHWNSRQSAAVGGYLLNALVKSCFIEVDLATALRQANFALPFHHQQDQSQPGPKRRGFKMGWLSGIICKPKFDEAKVRIAAFGHRVVRDGLKTIGILEMKECCMLKLRDAVAKGLVALSCLPMVCEPKPWTSVSNGGLALLKHYFIRTHTKPTFDVRVFDINGILDIVSNFGKVPWKINGPVYHILSQIWHGGMNLPIAKTLPDRDTSVAPTSMARANMLSECSLFERRLRIAQDFLNEPCIYFPQNIDFRGRMYPLSPHLNHMADDVCRGLLKFSNAKLLGDRGFFWLQVHLANMYGIDKVPFDERIQWVHLNLNLLRRLVENPLDGVSQSFWQRAESPMQFYAAAIEFISAIDSGNPHTFASAIPIQQDGSCNGLQHYAALGLDENGGAAVNLIPSDRPQDVYQQVLHEVIAKVRYDYQQHTASGSGGLGQSLGSAGAPGSFGTFSNSANGITRGKLAKVCLENGLLRRKIVKQTVMTICYGVTRLGAVAQIEHRLSEMEEEKVPRELLHHLARYIASQVLGSIATVFSEAMSIKKWLDNISAAHNRLNVPVVWISPIGLPCEQPYCKMVTRVVRTPIQAINISQANSASVDKRKQKLAFPPNFVHSLDASHLMLTARAVFGKGYDFAAVHDSFWTHACNVDDLHVEIRNNFVAMYEQPILQNLYKTCTLRLWGHVDIQPPPSTGTLDLNLVRRSTYFFH